MISPGRLWRGSARYHASKVLPRIVDWSWPVGTVLAGAPPVHVLTSGKDWKLAAWMLASWLQFSEHTWPIFIHDDGTLPKEASETLGKLFPGARVVDRREADAAVAPLLHA